MLGRLFGIPTPVNLALQETVERLARDGMSPGSLTLADIDFSQFGEACACSVTNSKIRGHTLCLGDVASLDLSQRSSASSPCVMKTTT